MLGLQFRTSDCVLWHSMFRVAAANPLHDVRFRSEIVASASWQACSLEGGGCLLSLVGRSISLRHS